MGKVGTIYLLCLNQPIRNSAKHYLGWSTNVDARENAHAKGRGAKFTKQAVDQGIGWKRVRTWENKTRDDERRLKKNGSLARLCPNCRSAYRRRRNKQQQLRRARDGRADRPRGNPRGPL